MPIVYDNLRDVKIMVDYRAAEINMRYDSIFTIYYIFNFIINSINIISLIATIVLALLSIVNIWVPAITLVGILLIAGILSHIKSIIIQNNKTQLVNMVNDIMSKYKDINRMSNEKLMRIITEDIAPIAGIEYIERKD